MDFKYSDNAIYLGDSPENYDAIISYVKAGDNTIIVDHTIVNENLQGQGIAAKLVEELVNFARKNNLKVLATCPYAKKKLEETPEYSDVLKAN